MTTSATDAFGSAAPKLSFHEWFGKPIAEGAGIHGAPDGAVEQPIGAGDDLERSAVAAAPADPASAITEIAGNSTSADIAGLGGFDSMVIDLRDLPGDQGTALAEAFGLEEAGVVDLQNLSPEQIYTLIQEGAIPPTKLTQAHAILAHKAQMAQEAAASAAAADAEGEAAAAEEAADVAPDVEAPAEEVADTGADAAGDASDAAADLADQGSQFAGNLLQDAQSQFATGAQNNTTGLDELGVNVSLSNEMLGTVAEGILWYSLAQKAINVAKILCSGQHTGGAKMLAIAGVVLMGLAVFAAPVLGLAAGATFAVKMAAFAASSVAIGKAQKMTVASPGMAA